jgi:hypothetical protein
MNIINRTLKLLTPDDPELVAKTLVRIDEQDKWNDVFSTKLIELLDNIDAIKKENREKSRQNSQELAISHERLATALKLAATAEQKRLCALTSFRKATQWVISISVFSWLATIGVVWSTYRTILPIWLPCIATASVLLAGISVVYRVNHEN